MLTDHERSLAVQSLRTAHVTKEPCVQLSTRFPNIEIEDSYAISSALAQERIRRGAKVIGHKIGLTSKAMQASSGILPYSLMQTLRNSVYSTTTSIASAVELRQSYFK
jgi:2-oxo-hept-3-ene-1,7-dioate hydratase